MLHIPTTRVPFSVHFSLNFLCRRFLARCQWRCLVMLSIDDSNLVTLGVSSGHRDYRRERRMPSVRRGQSCAIIARRHTADSQTRSTYRDTEINTKENRAISSDVYLVRKCQQQSLTGGFSQSTKLVILNE